MKLAITGGAGFLGMHACRLLSREHPGVRIIDRVAADPAEYPAGTEFVQADVRDRPAVVRALRGVRGVIHAAAALPLWPRREIFEVNLTGTENVLEACRENGVERFLHVSSTAVYGVPRRHPIEETDPLIGMGPYGQSKIEAEGRCLAADGAGGLRVAIVRPKTFVGTGRLGVFQILYEWIREGRRIPILGSGGNRYQLLDVEDLVEAMGLLLATDPAQASGVFNVGAQEFGTVADDLGDLCRHAGSGSRLLPLPAAPARMALAAFSTLGLSPLYSWVYATADKDSFVSTDRLQHLGWTARWSNAQTLIRSYQWYLDNRRSIPLDNRSHRAGWREGVLGLVRRLL